LLASQSIAGLASALKHRLTELSFESFHPLTDGRVRQIHLLGGARKGVALGKRSHRLQCVGREMMCHGETSINSLKLLLNIKTIACLMCCVDGQRRHCKLHSTEPIMSFTVVPRSAFFYAVVGAAAFTAGCSSMPTITISAPVPAVPPAVAAGATAAASAVSVARKSAANASKVAPPTDSKLLMKVPAVGMQIYRCTYTEGKLGWAFVAPEADLFDERGRLIGKHGAGPFWEMFDGSKINGIVAQREDSPRSGAIVHLLLSTQSTGGAGANPGSIAKVKHLQRLNTLGGVAPTNGCATSGDTDRQARIYYSADYYLYE
jgi:hypothetical protein